MYNIVSVFESVSDFPRPQRQNEEYQMLSLVTSQTQGEIGSLDDAIASIKWRLNNAEVVFGQCETVPGNKRYEDLRMDVILLRRTLCDALVSAIRKELEYFNDKRALALTAELDEELKKLTKK